MNDSAKHPVNIAHFWLFTSTTDEIHGHRNGYRLDQAGGRAGPTGPRLICLTFKQQHRPAYPELCNTCEGEPDPLAIYDGLEWSIFDFETPSPKKHSDTATKEPEEAKGNPRSAHHSGVGIQQEPHTNRYGSREDSGRDQHDRKVCPDLVPEQVS